MHEGRWAGGTMRRRILISVAGAWLIALALVLNALFAGLALPVLALLAGLAVSWLAESQWADAGRSDARLGLSWRFDAALLGLTLAALLLAAALNAGLCALWRSGLPGPCELLSRRIFLRLTQLYLPVGALAGGLLTHAGALLGRLRRK